MDDPSEVTYKLTHLSPPLRWLAKMLLRRFGRWQLIRFEFDRVDDGLNLVFRDLEYCNFGFEGLRIIGVRTYELVYANAGFFNRLRMWWLLRKASKQ